MPHPKSRSLPRAERCLQQVTSDVEIPREPGSYNAIIPPLHVCTRVSGEFLNRTCEFKCDMAFEFTWRGLNMEKSPKNKAKTAKIPVAR